MVCGFRDPQVIGSSGGWMVAKMSRFTDESLNSPAVVEAHAKSTAVARHYAALFNEECRRATTLSAVASGTKGHREPVGEPPALIFVPCFVYTKADVAEDCAQHQTDDPKVFAAERYLPGIFLKYNSNNGYVMEGPAKHKDVVQAFLHYSFVKSGGSLLVADLQGVARATEVLLTDPQVLTASPTEVPSFGPGDIGARGARTCLAAHRCGPTCKLLGLKPVSVSLLRKLEGAAANAGGPALAACRSPAAAGGARDGCSGAGASAEGATEWYNMADSEPRSSQASASSWVHLLDG